MIVWISSYPKSGNTYLRSFLSAYFFSKNGKFEFDQLINILQFPSIKFSKKDYFNFDDAARNWISNQNTFFDKKKFIFLKTHNSLENYKNIKFTTANQTIGAIYIVRDPRNIITSLCNHYSFTQEQAYINLIDKNASLSEKSVNGDCSNFTFLGSWSNHYKSWRDIKDFKVLFLKYEDLQNDKIKIFRKIINFIYELQGSKNMIDEGKFENCVRSTNFATLKNKELNEKFEESVYSKDGKKINFFNLGFKNKWQNYLEKDILEKLNQVYKNDLINLGYI